MRCGERFQERAIQLSACEVEGSGELWRTGGNDLIKLRVGGEDGLDRGTCIINGNATGDVSLAKLLH